MTLMLLIPSRLVCVKEGYVHSRVVVHGLSFSEGSLYLELDSPYCFYDFHWVNC